MIIKGVNERWLPDLWVIKEIASAKYLPRSLSIHWHSQILTRFSTSFGTSGEEIAVHS